MILVLSAGQAVAKDADFMSRLALFLRQIPDMAEDPADGRSETVNYAQRFCHEWARLEQPLSDIDRIAREHRIGDADTARHDVTVDLARDVRVGLIGAAAEAAGNRDCILNGHARYVGILAGLADFTHDVDRAIAIDIDRDVGIANIALSQLLGDLAGEVAARSCRGP